MNSSVAFLETRASYNCRAQWHFPTMLFMLWNVFEVAHGVGACACVCCIDMYIGMYPSHPASSLSSWPVHFWAMFLLAVCLCAHVRVHVCLYVCVHDQRRWQCMKSLSNIMANWKVSCVLRLAPVSRLAPWPITHSIHQKDKEHDVRWNERGELRERVSVFK